jgi:hypothetical protein
MHHYSTCSRPNTFFDVDIMSSHPNATHPCVPILRAPPKYDNHPDHALYVKTMGYVRRTSIDLIYARSMNHIMSQLLDTDYPGAIHIVEHAPDPIPGVRVLRRQNVTICEWPYQECKSFMLAVNVSYLLNRERDKHIVVFCRCNKACAAMKEEVVEIYKKLYSVRVYEMEKRLKQISFHSYRGTKYRHAQCDYLIINDAFNMTERLPDDLASMFDSGVKIFAMGSPDNNLENAGERLIRMHFPRLDKEE